jgi:Rrf2 family iron-sulfur cluster assembly transcriptional regulator
MKAFSELSKLPLDNTLLFKYDIIMKLTTKTRYAVRALVALAQRSETEALPLAIIAKRQRVKLKYLEQIFLRLHRARLVKSKKGPGGGYVLARNPKSIKLKDIMAAVGESTAPVMCVLNKRDKYCGGFTLCPMKPHWKELKKRIDGFMDEYTLADICENSSPKRGG